MTFRVYGKKYEHVAVYVDRSTGRYILEDRIYNTELKTSHFISTHLTFQINNFASHLYRSEIRILASRYKNYKYTGKNCLYLTKNSSVYYPKELVL